MFLYLYFAGVDWCIFWNSHWLFSCVLLVYLLLFIYLFCRVVVFLMGSHDPDSLENEACVKNLPLYRREKNWEKEKERRKENNPGEEGEQIRDRALLRRPQLGLPHASYLQRAFLEQWVLEEDIGGGIKREQLTSLFFLSPLPVTESSLLVGEEGLFHLVS